MEIRDRLFDFWGTCQIKSNLNLEELAQKVSEAICGGLPFAYGKHSIWEEVPSMYIDKSILGMLFIIGGYGKERGFEVAIWPNGRYSRYVTNNDLHEKETKIRLDFHLYHLLKSGLADYPEIEVIEPEIQG